MLHDRPGSTKGILLGFAAATLAALLLSPAAWSGGSGRCISALVPDPVVLPDGSVQPAGQLRICLARALSPVAGLHETYVDGRAVGRFISQAGQAEAGDEAETPFFVFRRSPAGALVLEGYADPRGNRLDTYRVHKTGEPDVVTYWQTVREIGAEGGRQDDMILLAAARN
jgi:hypothetical protein